MNRLDFIGQSHEGRVLSVDDVVNFFDHMMAAYEVLEAVDDISINRVPDNSYNSFKINITSLDQSELANIEDNINNNLHNRKNIYNRSFSIEANLEGSILGMIVKEIINS